MTKESLRNRLDNSLKNLGRKIEQKLFQTPAIDNLDLTTPERSKKYEFVSLKNHRISCETLEKFVNLDPERIHTLQNLNEKISEIGEALKQIILVNGQIDLRSENAETIAVKEKIDDHTIYGTVFTDIVILAAYKELNNGNNPGLYNVRIPYNHNIIPTEDPLYNLRFIAFDWRNEEDKVYCPGNNPEDKDHLAGYASVLKEAVGGLLTGINLSQQRLDKYEKTVLSVKR